MAVSEYILTEEQQKIVESSGDICINAVAGSGKTSTLIAYAASRPLEARILYLAFNRSVKQEAVRRFAEAGLHNVQVETAHSLAFRAIIPGSRYKLRAQGFRTHEIVSLLQISSGGEKHMEYILANHINRFITYFCNSDAKKVGELNYLDIVSDSKARTYVKQHYRQIEKGARLLLAKMDSGEIEIIHDFYLKKFQLSEPVLPFDYILFDEGQDASGAMLDIFLRQRATKVIVGDAHQQIYGWRFAVNSLAKAPYPLYTLSTSFRFYPSHAALACAVLQWKEKIGITPEVRIEGKGKCRDISTKATLARTNLGLLTAAVDYISDPRNPRKIYFEGNFHSYTYADDGASLYDVLNLSLEKRDRIRDPLVKSMGDLNELEEYVEKTEDQQMGMMIELVKEYNEELPRIIRELKDLHIGDDQRHEADMIFSTVHRAKGMEYDKVILAADFINEQKMARWLKDKDAAPDKQKWNEEINLLYVAVTRAKNLLEIPELLLPEDFAPQPPITVTARKEEKALKEIKSGSATPFWKKRWQENLNRSGSPVKKYSVAEKRESYKQAYAPWTEELDAELSHLYEQGISIKIIAEEMNRTKGAILARLKKLNLV
jgi:superfamily I DNA/RNA helicase